MGRYGRQRKSRLARLDPLFIEVATKAYPDETNFYDISTKLASNIYRDLYGKKTKKK